jgi:hypothetical protein
MIKNVGKDCHFLEYTLDNNEGLIFFEETVIELK